MNAVDTMLRNDLDQLMDRLSVTVRSGSLAAASAAHPQLRARLDDAEACLAAARTALLDDYGRWQRVLDDLENLWAAAAWASGPAEEPAEYAAPRAA